MKKYTITIKFKNKYLDISSPIFSNENFSCKLNLIEESSDEAISKSIKYLRESVNYRKSYGEIIFINIEHE